MSILDFFRRKKEEPEFPEDLKAPEFPKEEEPLEFKPTQGVQPAFQPSQPSFQPQSFGQTQDNSKDLEVINAKLDTIKVMLDHVMEKLNKMEKEKEESKYPLKWR